MRDVVMRYSEDSCEVIIMPECGFPLGADINYSKQNLSIYVPGFQSAPASCEEAIEQYKDNLDECLYELFPDFEDEGDYEEEREHIISQIMPIVEKRLTELWECGEDAFKKCFE